MRGPVAAERILVVRLGALGDVIRTLPAARRLRSHWPAARLAWLVEPAAASALEAQSWIDRVLVFPRDALSRELRSGHVARAARGFSEFTRALRAERFDLVLDFHGLLRSALLARASGAPRRIGYARPVAREGAAWFATDRAELAPGRCSRYARNAGLVDFLGVPPESVAEPFELAAPARSPVTRARAEFAVLHAGSSRGAAYKRYPPERLGDVARELLARAGLRCVVTRGVDAQERELAQRVVAASGGAAELAPELADLADLASLLAAARVVIGADTGPLHLAATVGTPVVQLMGPTDPVENAPWERTPSRQLHAGLACSPCRRGCPEATCMTRLAPAEIAAAAAELIRRSPLEAAAAP